MKTPVRTMGCLLLLTAAASAAAQAHALGEDEPRIYHFVHTSDHIAVFIDVTSIVGEGDTVGTWFLWVPLAERNAAGRRRVAYRRVRMSHACANRTVRLMESASYDLSGRLLARDGRPTSPHAPPPDSLNDFILRYVCWNKRRDGDDDRLLTRAQAVQVIRSLPPQQAPASSSNR